MPGMRKDCSARMNEQQIHFSEGRGTRGHAGHGGDTFILSRDSTVLTYRTYLRVLLSGGRSRPQGRLHGSLGRESGGPVEVEY